jgi:hypothetical protein
VYLYLLFLGLKVKLQKSAAVVDDDEEFSPPPVSDGHSKNPD